MSARGPRKLALIGRRSHVTRPAASRFWRPLTNEAGRAFFRKAADTGPSPDRLVGPDATSERPNGRDVRRTAAEMLLSDAGYEVTLAETGKGAVSLRSC